MEDWMSRRGLYRLVLAVCTIACVLIGGGAAALGSSGGNSNAGDVWVDNVGQPSGPGHEMDPHLACQDINLWGSGLADPGGSFTVDGWPPSGSQEQDYAPTSWKYNQPMGGSQVLQVISVSTLIKNAIAHGDSPVNKQGFHFKLEFSQDPQKHKTFWVNCADPTIATTASQGTVGQPIHDAATLSGSNAATGTISWNVYASGDTKCSTALNSSPLTTAVNGDGNYNSPDFTPSSPGTYQWVATYSGDNGNLSVAAQCNDPEERSTVSKAAPSIATTATSNTPGRPVHDVATLTGGDSPTGTITWNVYAANAGCTTSQYSATVMVTGDGIYNSPDFTPPAAGTYQWVATYSGDANNGSIATSCTDPKEQSTISSTPATGIALVKLERDGSSGSFMHGPITGNVTDTINYQMTVINTGNTNLVTTFSDPRCDTGTLSGPVVVSGVFDTATSTLHPDGELQYTCSHVLAAGDAPRFTNTASVSGQPPTGPPVSASDSVVVFVNTAGINVVKLQRDGSSGAYTTGTITAKVGDTIEYEIQVTNTGTSTLALSLNDPLCDASTVSGPTALSGTLNGNVLSPSGEAQYTCNHILNASDASPFINTATVTGQPPTGPAVSGTSSVTANKQAIKAVKVVKVNKCTKGKVKKTKKVHGKTVTACVAKKKVKAVAISRKPKKSSGFTG
jgi:hypothetical protein